MFAVSSKKLIARYIDPIALDPGFTRSILLKEIKLRRLVLDLTYLWG